MEIRTYLGDCRFLETDVILAGIYEDEIPPQGMSGYLDWYLFGQVTELILAGKFSGKQGQWVLLATQGKIAAPKLMVMGLGEKAKMTAEVFKNILPTIIDKIKTLLVESAAVELLDHQGTGLKPWEAARHLIKSLRGNREPPAANIIIIPPDESRREMVEKLLW